MATLSLTSDHLVQIGGTGAPQKVTVLAGAPVSYSHDRTRVAVGKVNVGDAVTFEQSAWMWSPHLSDIRVEDAPQTTLREAMEEWFAEAGEPREGGALEEFIQPKPTWPRVPVVVAIAVYIVLLTVAEVLTAVGVLH